MTMVVVAVVVEASVKRVVAESMAIDGADRAHAQMKDIEELDWVQYK